MVKVVKLTVDDITSDMLSNFHHSQRITQKWTYRDHQWELMDTSDLREWSKEKRRWIPQYLQKQMIHGGCVVAAYDENVLVGFCAVDGSLRGTTASYANLTMLFVDDRWKRKGIGSKLFCEICKQAENMKADKLFISAIPSAETVAFYFHMGCEDAKEIVLEYVDTEHDRYLECLLATRV